MIKVSELEPGAVVRLGNRSATFVVRTVHPIWPALQLVVWKLDDGTWSHDALDAEQYVGDAVPSDEETRLTNLRTALLVGEG